MQKIAEILNHLRLKKGLTQEELAEKLGISASYLSLLERAKRPPTKRVLRCLSGYLKLPAGYFVLQNMKLGELSPRHRALVKDIRRELVEPAFERIFAKERKPKTRRNTGDRPDGEAGHQIEANVSSPEASDREIPSPQVPSLEVPSPEVSAPEILNPSLSSPDFPSPGDEHEDPAGRPAEAEGQSD